MAQLYTSDVVVKPFAVGLAQPVDVRTIVSNLSDLVTKSTFNSIQKICAGMPIAVVEEGKSGIWMLPDASAYNTLQTAMLQSSWADPTNVTEETVLGLGWVKLPTTAEVDAALEEIKSSLTAEGISYTRTGKDYDDVAGAIDDLYAGLASAGSQEGINDLTNKVTALEDTVNGKGETPSLQSQITANANAIATLNGKVTYNIVESLPTENIDPNIFYLVLDSEAEEDGETFYKEYLYVNNEWELVGTTHASLDGYITETDAKQYADDQAAQALADAKADTTSQITALNLATTYAPISVVETAEGAADKADENAGKIAALETTVNGAEGTTGLVTRVGELEDYKTTHDGLYNSLNQQVSTNTGDIATINNNLGSYLTIANAEATYETIENVAALTATVTANKTAADTGIQEAKTLAQEAKDGLADKVTNNSLATTLASYQTQDLTITDFDTEGVQATVESALLANKNAMAANTTNISGLTTRMGAVETLAGNAATKESVEALAGEAGRVTVVEGKVSALEGTVGDATKGLVKDVADLSANKADKDDVASTYLKKSGDTSLELGISSDEQEVSGDLLIHGNVSSSFYTRLQGGYIFAQSDNGSTTIDGGNTIIKDGSLTVRPDGSTPIEYSVDISAHRGFSGSFVDTTIPETPAEGHIATTGAIKTYVDAEVQSVKDSVATAYTFKGSKTYEEISAIADAKPGDVYNSTTEVTLSGVKYPVGTNFAWDGAAWEPLSGTIDISAYATTASVTEALEAQANSFQGVIDAVEEEVEKKAAIDGSNLGTLSDTAKISWKTALGFATADDQVQSDWYETDTTSKAYIANKPAIKRVDEHTTILGESTTTDTNVAAYNTFRIPGAHPTDVQGQFIKQYGYAPANTTITFATWGDGRGTCFSVMAHFVDAKIMYEVSSVLKDGGFEHSVEAEVIHMSQDSIQIPTLTIGEGSSSSETYEWYHNISFSKDCSYIIDAISNII